MQALNEYAVARLERISFPKPLTCGCSGSHPYVFSEVFDLKPTSELYSRQRHNRCTTRKQNAEVAEAAIEASSLTRSDPELVLGTGPMIGHWPPKLTNETSGCCRTLRLRSAGERGLLFPSLKTLLFCPSFGWYKTVSVRWNSSRCDE